MAKIGQFCQKLRYPNNRCSVTSVIRESGLADDHDRSWHCAIGQPARALARRADRSGIATWETSS